MFKALRSWTVLGILVAIVAAAPAIAQFPSGPDDQEGSASKSKARKPAEPNGPNIAGSWSGQLIQVGSQSPYKFEIVINARGAETRYPDLDCTGRLTRVGSAKAYAFFTEAITKGQVDKGGRCPDGTITVARQGDELALSWFGSVQGNTIVAYGNLKKK
ncbi:MAG TPA: hypothetical protein VGH39_07155 [Xanthobacteraceae bacterium]|jgi:hypothetical protein